ncbi:hypothetical protein ACFL5O_08690 [Myxococcota bacterium]
MRPTQPRQPVDESNRGRVEQVVRELGQGGLSGEHHLLVQAILGGRDAVVTAPPSLDMERAVEAAGLLLGQPVVLLSPHVATLRERHDRLAAQRIPVARLDPATPRSEREQVLTRIAEGAARIVYTTPGTLAMVDMASALSAAGIAQVALTDAHALSSRAHELGAGYYALPSLLARLGCPPIVAITTGARPDVRNDIISKLGLRSPVVIGTAVHRPSITLETVCTPGKARPRALVSLVMRLRRPGLIMAHTAQEVDRIHENLRALRLPVHRYHEDLSSGERAAELLNFAMPGRRSIMVATSGLVSITGWAGLGESAELDRVPSRFGLGLRKRDLRFVVHYYAPASLEQYVKEIDWCSQDGEFGQAILFHGPEDESQLGHLLGQGRIQAPHLRRVGQTLTELAGAPPTGTLESVAFMTGLDQRIVNSVVTLLEEAGWVARSGGWIKVLGRGPDLLEHCQDLADQVGDLGNDDLNRWRALRDYVESGECHSVALAKHFGFVDSSPCGRCSVCTGNRSVLPGGAEPTHPPRHPNRAQSRRQRPTRTGSSGTESAADIDMGRSTPKLRAAVLG